MMNNLDCIIPIWKDSDWTSNDVIKYIKPFVSPNKIGHAGTLDPFAKGILVVCIGKMTKKVSEIMDSEKEYLVEIKLGERTDTLDCTGVITNIKDSNHINDKMILESINQFKGLINQVPPMFSALKYKGQRLYKLARKGIKVEREAREVFIKKIDFVSFSQNILCINVQCGKGTYIRSLARDIAHSLGTEGFVQRLVRTRIGNFNKKNSINVKDFKDWLLSQRHILN